MNARIVTFIGLIATVTAISAQNSLSSVGGSRGVGKTDYRRFTITSAQQICQDPLRKINGQLHDLTPIFAWVQADATRQNWDVLVHSPQPMPQWKFVSGKVFQILKEGVMLESGNSNYKLIKNWPKAATLKDGDDVRLLAMESGTYSYQGGGGGTFTLAAYDYGTLPTPEEMAAMKAAAEKRAAEAKATADTEKQKKLSEGEVRLLEYQKKRAAEGSSIHQYDLALRYLEGRGIEKNEAEAKQLMEASAKQGHKPAIEKLKTLP